MSKRGSKAEEASNLFTPEQAPAASSISAASAKAPAKTKKPHYHGHRDRLRARFMEGGADSLPDYELLELLLFQVIPRRDVKPLAKQLIEGFGSIAGVLNASDAELKPYKIDGNKLVALRVVRAMAERLARQEVRNKPVISSWKALTDYLHIAMAGRKTEQFRVIFLDRKNQVITDEVQQEGTLDETALYPREIVKRALELEAGAIILVHNHPSGDPDPSRADIKMTQEVKQAAEGLDIHLHDHIIIGRHGHASFKSMGLL
ncbi:MAG: DNA repair protein RadC [Alphaproteobacteria bacterium]